MKVDYKSFKFSEIRLLIKVVVLASFVITTSGYALSTVPGNIYHLLLLLPIVVFFLLKKDDFYSAPLNIFNTAYYIFIILTAISFIVNGNISSFSTNFKFLITVTFAYLFSNYISFPFFVKYFISTMKFIVITSLVGYILFNFIKIPINLPTFVNVNGVEYYNAILLFAPSKGFGIGRNTGCFWEPGVFSTFIIFALIFELAFKEKTSKINVIIFLVGLLSTQSTSGYLMVLFLIILKVSNKYRGFKAFIIYVVSIVLAVVAYFNLDRLYEILYSINPYVFGKLLVESANVASRIESPLTNLDIFLKYPIFGAGIGNADNLYHSATEAAQTSTSTYFLGIFGILGILYTLFFVYGILSYKMLNKFSRITILIIILLQINKEPHLFFTATYIIMFYFLKISTSKYQEL